MLHPSCTASTILKIHLTSILIFKNIYSLLKQEINIDSIGINIIFEPGIGENQWKNVMALSLPHPKTKLETLFLLDFRTDVEAPSTNFVYEIQSTVADEGLA